MSKPSALPPHGWTVMSPTVPNRCCRWCGRPNVLVRAMVLCPKCDEVTWWPNSRLGRAA